jgi:hypothetical protein
MKYAVLNAKDELVTTADVDDINDAKRIAGLEPIGVDHGTISRGMGIVVYEYGLMEPHDHYMIINRQLYAGNAVIYSYDTAGETVDVGELPDVKFLHGVMAVEQAIKAGEAIRPYVAVNGAKLAIWRHGALRSV